MSIASLLGALTWKEQFDDDEAQTRARVIATKMRARKRGEDASGAEDQADQSRQSQGRNAHGSSEAGSRVGPNDPTQ
jgi:hypothetical protein